MWLTAWILIGSMSGSKAALPMPLFGTQAYCEAAKAEMLQLDPKAKLSCITSQVWAP